MGARTVKVTAVPVQGGLHREILFRMLMMGITNSWNPSREGEPSFTSMGATYSYKEVDPITGERTKTVTTVSDEQAWTN